MNIDIAIVALLGFIVLQQALVIRLLIQIRGEVGRTAEAQPLIVGLLTQVRGEVTRSVEAKTHRHLIGG